MPRLLLRFSPACPNCGGPIGEDRLEGGLPCRRCLPEPPAATGGFEEKVLRVGEVLARRGVLRGYWALYTGVERLRGFEEFFSRATGGLRLWSAQRTWARRLLGGESLAIVAPTGVGKTTLLTAYTLYRALVEGGHVYYLLPTENLVAQVVEKLRGMAERLGEDPGLAWYSSGRARSRGERRRLLEEIASGGYRVLVTTTGFLQRHWGLLEGKRFDTVVVDDVDSILRNSRNIDRILVLLGFPLEAVEKAYRLVKKRVEAAIAKATGRMRILEERLREVSRLEAELAALMAEAQPGQLVVASATGRVRGLKPRVFRELLGFEVGRVYDYTRSIAEFSVKAGSLVDEVVGVVERLASKGYPGLVFVAKRYGKETARRIAGLLVERGVRAAVALAGSRVLDRFARGDLDVLVGVASYYGVIVRGLDMPHRVYYTVFAGVPAQKMSLEKALNSPYRVLRFAAELGIPGAEEALRTFSRLTPNEASVLRIALEKGERLEGRLGEALELLRELRRRVAQALQGARLPLVIGGVLVVEDGGGLAVVIPDAATYVQASGRASRMLGSAMTHGVSIVVEEDPELLELLAARLRAYVEKAVFEPLDWNRVWEELRRAEESRRSGSGREVRIETSLIVVESPTKAKTIAGFFGRPLRRRIGEVVVYETTFYNPHSGKIHVAAIAASRGHIYDLTIDQRGVYGVEVGEDRIVPHYAPIRQCLNCGAQFASENRVCPRCGSANTVSKEAVVDALRKLALEVEKVYLATDPDLEGEKIAYDLYLLLKPYAPAVERIELHEITRQELYRALASPRSVSKRAAYAQVVRRIEDRWIGFGLSQVLWSVYGKTWLGAGRVQTPVLGWIIARYGEWRRGLGYNLYLALQGGLRIVLHYEGRGEAEEALRSAEEEGVLVASVSERVVELSPPPPYTTETLIYDASRLLGYTSEKTMRVAQELFEAGLITYHRTDSHHVSPAGVAVAKAYMESHGLAVLLQPRLWGEKGHHEAIRPTQPIDAGELRRRVAMGEMRPSVRLRESHYRLYDLVFRRFMASQAARARLAEKKLVLEVAGRRVEATVYTGAVEEGYTRFYPQPRILPHYASLQPGSRLAVEKARLARGSTVRLYTHGDVVMLMRQRGIGRPSTYTRTITVLKGHGYIVESRYRHYLVPTKLGVEVYEFLTDNYGWLVSEERTRQLYEKMEEAASGKARPEDLIMELYGELQEILAPVHAGAGEATVEAG